MNAHQDPVLDPNLRAARMAAILAETRPVQRGDVIEQVMHACGFPATLPPTARVHPHLAYTLGSDEVFGYFPAAVFPFQRGNGDHAGMEVMYLDKTGVAPVVKPWQLHWVSEDRIQGAFFQVSDGAPEVIAVTAGITEAISVWQLCGEATVCAVRSHDDLAAFDWPERTTHLQVYVNGPSEAAGRALADRAMRAGLTVELLSPITPGATFFQELAFAGAVPCDQEAEGKANAAAQANEDSDSQKGE